MSGWKVNNPEIAKLLEKNIQKAAQEKPTLIAPTLTIEEAMKWVYGPVYASLPKPLKEASSWTANMQERYRQLEIARHFTVEANNALTVERAEQYIRSVAFSYALSLDRVGVNRISGIFRHVPGLGSIYAHPYTYALHEGVNLGHTPGQWVMEKPNEMHEAVVRAYKRGWRNRKAPPFRIMNSLRTWWVENEGTA